MAGSAYVLRREWQNCAVSRRVAAVTDPSLNSWPAAVFEGAAAPLQRGEIGGFRVGWSHFLELRGPASLSAEFDGRNAWVLTSSAPVQPLVLGAVPCLNAGKGEELDRPRLCWPRLAGRQSAQQRRLVRWKPAAEQRGRSIAVPGRFRLGAKRHRSHV